MSLTALVITTVVITLGIYDLWAVTYKGVQWSISRFVQRVSFKSPVFTFMVGFVSGHLFSYMAPEPDVIEKPVVRLEKIDAGTDEEGRGTDRH